MLEEDENEDSDWQEPSQAHFDRDFLSPRGNIVSEETKDTKQSSLKITAIQMEDSDESDQNSDSSGESDDEGTSPTRGKNLQLLSRSKTDRFREMLKA